MAVHSSPRTSSARLTLVGLLLIPLVSLAALWGLTASITLGNVIRDQHNNQIISTLQPSIVPLEQSLTAERTLTIAWLDSGRRSAQTRTQLLAARHSTDADAATARTAFTLIRGLENTQAPLDNFLSELADLPSIRTAVDSGRRRRSALSTPTPPSTPPDPPSTATGTPPGYPTLSLHEPGGHRG